MLSVSSLSRASGAELGSFVITSYLTVAHSGVAEIEVSGSRFRCQVERVVNEFEARTLVASVRRQQDAREHCSAMIVGPEAALARSSDDSEPPGTAGAPLLEILRAGGLTDVVVVVSRWAGDVPLGTGELTRAYADVTRAALADAGELQRVLHEVHAVAVDHAHVGRVERGLRARGTTVLGIDYTDQAVLRLAVPAIARGVAEEIVAEVTGGAGTMEHIGEQWVDR